MCDCCGLEGKEDDIVFFFSSRRRHTRSLCDWSSDMCSSDLIETATGMAGESGGERAATCFAFRSLDQHGRPSSLRRIAIDPVKGLHVIGFAVARLALLVVGFAVG